MIESNNRAIVLFVALSTLIIVVILANILLRIVLNQSWFTKHHQSRIQAHYAGLAGLNYAFEKLRTGDPNWPATGDYTHKICRSGCNNPGDMNDPDLPFAIHSVNIHVFGANAGIPGTKTRKVQIAVKYSMWGS
ncbi:MAG: hypothetical protein WC335_09880 [Candidatus Omnitrophota bacterium]|jgi:hypothetical protein